MPKKMLLWQNNVIKQADILKILIFNSSDFKTHIHMIYFKGINTRIM